jgi:phosphoserine phosphatase
MIVAFDFDGTLSDSEMTVLLGERCGAADEMEQITERAMNDEIAYAESLRERCALLEGLDDADAGAAFEEVRLRPGAAEVIEALRKAGVYVAILTGGFERGVEAALDREDVAVDAVVANRLPVADDTLTGGVEGPLIEGTKDDALEVLRAVVGDDETVAVGDGANDLPMLEVADLAVGFEPKPNVEPACDVVVGSMDELLALFESRGLL